MSYLYIPKKLYNAIPELRGKYLPRDNEEVHDILIKYLDNNSKELYKLSMETIGKIEYYFLANMFNKE